MITPSLAEFRRLSRRHNLIPLRREIVVDQVTPVSVSERLQKGAAHSFLLESVEGGERFGRYSFVGRRPRALFVCKGDQAVYREGSSERRWTTSNPLLDLKVIFAEISPAPLATPPVSISIWRSLPRSCRRRRVTMPLRSNGWQRGEGSCRP